MRRLAALVRTMLTKLPVLALSLALGILADLGIGAPGGRLPIVMAQATPHPDEAATASISDTHAGSAPPRRLSTRPV